MASAITNFIDALVLEGYNTTWECFPHDGGQPTAVAVCVCNQDNCILVRFSIDAEYWFGPMLSDHSVLGAKLWAPPATLEAAQSMVEFLKPVLPVEPKRELVWS